MSEKQYRDKIVSIKKKQAVEEDARAKANKAASKHRSDADKHRAKIKPTTSEPTASSYERSARSADQRAEREEKKAADASGRLAKLARDLASATTSLEREQTAARRREESARKSAETRRRRSERRHARELGRLSSATIRHVHEVRAVPAPKAETLRVLYLTANPEQDLRTEAEVRAVQDEVRRALHRDLIEIDYRPAATGDDLIAGLNDTRPHVVHFSGHAGDAVLLFDNGSIDQPKEHEVPYDLLARALGATDVPPVTLVLNGCETMNGAEVLLEATGVVIATAASVSDLAASVFAAKFYAAIAAAQPIEVAVDQGSVAVDLAGLDEGWKPQVLAREDIDVSNRVLVQVPESRP